MTELAEFQRTMDAVYGERDRARGVPATVAWLAEEVGELAKAARKGTVDEQLHELGDVLAWLASLANQLGLSLEDAAARYASGCPRCGAIAVRVPVSLLVVTGPPGAGKSTVAALVADRLPRSVLVEGDAFFAFVRRDAIEPWLPESHAQNEIVDRSGRGRDRTVRA